MDVNDAVDISLENLGVSYSKLLREKDSILVLMIFQVDLYLMHCTCSWLMLV